MNLRNKFERFCFRNRGKGIPNLMLYIALGNAIVILLSMFHSGSALYSLLCFDKDAILRGQVWRLVTYVFTQSGGGILEIFFLYFFYMLGRHVELSMGTFRFNLFYLSGVVLMDVFAMIFCPAIPDVITGESQYTYLLTTVSIYQGMAYYLHLSLLLTFATTNPDSQFLIFFIIPIKAWILAVIYLVLVIADIFNLSYPVFYFPHNLFPLVALANYLLFAGKDIVNLLPLQLRLRRKKNHSPRTNGPIPFRKDPETKKNYLHKCAVCGRTDASNPELEFRYCSRCNGYHCYCQDHINNHTHIQ